MAIFDFNIYKGKIFGCLKVIEYSYYDNERKLNFAKVKCLKCSNIFNIPTNRLRSNKHSYCIKCSNKKERITHNKRIRRIYANMKTRCYNPISNRYYVYGGRGIKVCDEWKNSYTSFENWAFKNGYQDDLTLDRIDNNGNYEPSNCRWTTIKQQQRNTSKNRKITINNITKTIIEWCEYYNVPYYIVNNRINKYNWDIIKSFTYPIRKAKRRIICIETNKIYDSITEASNEMNISKTRISESVRRKKPIKGYHWEFLD